MHSVSMCSSDCDEASIVAAARNIRLDFTAAQWAAESMELPKQFIRACMVADREKRPTATSLLAHPWIAPAKAGDTAAIDGTAPASSASAGDAPLGLNAEYKEMLEETIAIEAAAKASGA